jgi:hypothetical protein
MAPLQYWPPYGWKAPWRSSTQSILGTLKVFTIWYPHLAQRPGSQGWHLYDVISLLERSNRFSVISMLKRLELFMKVANWGMPWLYPLVLPWITPILLFLVLLEMAKLKPVPQLRKFCLSYTHGYNFWLVQLLACNKIPRSQRIWGCSTHPSREWFQN